MVGVGVIIVGHGVIIVSHGGRLCNYNRPWLGCIVGGIIVGHGWWM